MVAEATAATILISLQQPYPHEDKQGRPEGGREGIGKDEIIRAIFPSLLLYLSCFIFLDVVPAVWKSDQGGCVCKQRENVLV